MDEKRIITTTLRYGVIIASILVIAGLIIFIISDKSPSDIYKFNTSSIPLTDYMDPLTITLYGVVVLISIPILIVFEQVLIYLFERDKIYVTISLVVLLLMLFAILIMPRLLL
ncbi:DUF1634 domain-containing protein [Sulfurisphaera javensis]|uniref:DUF1634 domain-containing protein n=1 Tax=Sulfurisphaera javensis TaxID=2049879 RepID=UPI0034E8514A